MQSSVSHPKNRAPLLRVLMLVLIGVTAYAVQSLTEAGQLYDQTSARIAEAPSVAKIATVEGASIDIPTYDLFDNGNIWMLVSKKQPLKGEADFTLIDIPVAHGDEGKSMKIARDISDELQQLVNAAEADGESLMVSSAYRSLQEQKELHNHFVAENGAAAAAMYVSPVGASEHHTGLSVDFSSVSDECGEDSDSCSLSQSGAAWLAENAHRFGFIQRYPAGKQEVTGVGYEPWHFRYVGRPMAEVIAKSDLTFEEVIEQIAPGYLKSR